MSVCCTSLVWLVYLFINCAMLLYGCFYSKEWAGHQERAQERLVPASTASFFSSHLARRFFAVVRDGRRDAEGPDSGR